MDLHKVTARLRKCDREDKKLERAAMTELSSAGLLGDDGKRWTKEQRQEVRAILRRHKIL